MIKYLQQQKYSPWTSFYYNPSHEENGSPTIQIQLPQYKADKTEHMI
jgi:hypothetical protein